MGNTTIIELNHDRHNEIFKSEKTKNEFLEQIREQLSSYKYNGESIRGGRVILGFHRSGIIEDRWSLFKEWLRNNTL